MASMVFYRHDTEGAKDNFITEVVKSMISVMISIVHLIMKP